MTLKMLVCPQCSSSFRVKADAIGDQGRQVRCSACAHEWLANKLDLQPLQQGDAPDENNEPVQEAEQVAAEQVDITEEDSTATENEFGSDAQDNGVDTDHIDDDDDADALAATLSEPTAFMPSPNYSKPDKPPQKIALWVALNGVCCLALIFIALVTFRTNVLTSVPFASLLYKSIGFADTSGLQFANIEHATSQSRHQWRYDVRGGIRNNLESEQAAPIIRARIITDKGSVAKEWLLPQEGNIIAGTTYMFNESKLRTYAENAATIQLDAGSKLELMLRP